MGGRIRTVDRLALSRAEALELAHAHLDQLVAASRGVVATASHDPDTAHCVDAGCGLAAIPSGAEVCAVAHRLANLTAAQTPLPATDDLGSALHDFRAALTLALDAVRACRQTAHANGACWFSHTPGADGCAEVLRLAHRLG